jgi:Protein of unknown function (DUF2585)
MSYYEGLCLKKPGAHPLLAASIFTYHNAMIQQFTSLSLLPAAIIMAATAAIERWNGRIYICKCGFVKLWEGVPNGAGNSQHIADWYSLSHIIHGFLFYGLTHLIARHASMTLRLGLATLIECGWEILENSSFIIDRYREATISLDYFGDSILNSMCDVGFMVLGFWAASRLPTRITIAAAIAMELLALTVIRDNLTLNVVMLLHPLEIIKNWQAAL